MAISNYGELKSAIADWLMREDLTSVIPTFIDMAHARLNRQLRVRDMVVRATAVADAQFTQLPADFLEMRNLQINTMGGIPLNYVTAHQMDEYRMGNGDSAGTPALFTITGDLLELWPTPSQEFDVEMAYYSKIATLSDDADTNWLLDKAPEVYLYGALAQAAPYLKEDERIQVWASLHDRALQELRDEDERARFMGSTPTIKARTFG